MDENFKWWDGQQESLDEVDISQEDVVVIWTGARSGKTLMSVYCALNQKNDVCFADFGNKHDVLKRHVETFRFFDETVHVDEDKCSMYCDTHSIKFISYKNLYKKIKEGDVVILHEADYGLRSEDAYTFLKFIKDKKVKQVIVFAAVYKSPPTFTTKLLLSCDSLKLIKHSTFYMNPNITSDLNNAPYRPLFEYTTIVTGID